MSTFFDFQQILIITDDDESFRKELLTQYSASFKTFPDEYATLFRQGHEQDMRFLIHKVKATIRMVGGDELEQLLANSAQIIADNGDPEPTILRVKQLCALLVFEIEELIK
jgi:hypothetical protein